MSALAVPSQGNTLSEAHWIETTPRRRDLGEVSMRPTTIAVFPQVTGITELDRHLLPLYKLNIANWDGQGAAPIEEAAIARIARLLRHLVEAGLPVPDLVPLTSGGVRAEWEDEMLDVSIDVHSFAPVTAYAWRTDGQTEEEFEGKLTDLPSTVLTALAQRSNVSA